MIPNIFLSTFFSSCLKQNLYSLFIAEQNRQTVNREHCCGQKWSAGGSSMVHLVMVGNPAGTGICGVTEQSCIGFLSLIGCPGPPHFIICYENNGLSVSRIPLSHCRLFTARSESRVTPRLLSCPVTSGWFGRWYASLTANKYSSVCYFAAGSESTEGLRGTLKTHVILFTGDSAPPLRLLFSNWFQG